MFDEVEVKLNYLLDGKEVVFIVKVKNYKFDSDVVYYGFVFICEEKLIKMLLFWYILLM